VCMSSLQPRVRHSLALAALSPSRCDSTGLGGAHLHVSSRELTRQGCPLCNWSGAFGAGPNCAAGRATQKALCDRAAGCSLPMLGRWEGVSPSVAGTMSAHAWLTPPGARDVPPASSSVGVGRSSRSRGQCSSSQQLVSHHHHQPRDAPAASSRRSRGRSGNVSGWTVATSRRRGTCLCAAQSNASSLTTSPLRAPGGPGGRLESLTKQATQYKANEGLLYIRNFFDQAQVRAVTHKAKPTHVLHRRLRVLPAAPLTLLCEYHPCRPSRVRAVQRPGGGVRSAAPPAPCRAKQHCRPPPRLLRPGACLCASHTCPWPTSL